jgi:hypothetical protein
MIDCWGNLKLPGDSRPKRQQVYTLRQEELEIESLSLSFNDASAKLQDFSVLLDHITLLPELKKHVQISYVSMAFVVATKRDKGGIDAVFLAKNWGIGIKAARRTRLDHPNGDTTYYPPKFDKKVQHQWQAVEISLSTYNDVQCYHVFNNCIKNGMQGSTSLLYWRWLDNSFSNEKGERSTWRSLFVISHRWGATFNVDRWRQGPSCGRVQAQIA